MQCGCRTRGWVIGFACSGHCTASTRSGRVHSLPWGVATRLFPNNFGEDLFAYLPPFHRCKCKWNNHNSQIFGRRTNGQKQFLSVVWPLILQHSVGNVELSRPVDCPRTIDVIDTRRCRPESYTTQQLSSILNADASTGNVGLSENATLISLVMMKFIRHRHCAAQCNTK